MKGPWPQGKSARPAVAAVVPLPLRLCRAYVRPLLALVLALASACGGAGNAGYTLRLDASAQHIPYGKRFFILPGVTADRAGDASFQAVADVLAQALAAKGYERMPALEQADVGIYLSVGVTAGSRHAVFSDLSQGAGPRAQRAFVFTEYTRELTAEAVDMARFRANDPHNVVWRMHAVSVGPTRNMDKAMPYFAAAVAQYAGSNGFFTVQVAPDMTVTPVNPEPRKRAP